MARILSDCQLSNFRGRRTGIYFRNFDTSFPPGLPASGSDRLSVLKRYGLRLHPGLKRCPEGPFQAYADLIILTILLHFSGGIENPLTLMLLVHVLIAGIVLSQEHLRFITALAIVLLIIMATGEATGLFHHYTLNIFPHFEHQGSPVHAARQPCM